MVIETVVGRGDNFKPTATNLTPMQTNHITVRTTDGKYILEATVKYIEGEMISSGHWDSPPEYEDHDIHSIITDYGDDVERLLRKDFDNDDLCNGSEFEVNEFPKELRTENYTYYE